MIPKKEVGKATPSPPGRAAGSAMAVSLLKSDRWRLGRTQKGSMVRSTLGVTLVELMVVLAIVSILFVTGIVGYNHYKEQYAFSGAVRQLTHAITVARVRAIQSQSTSRLLFRPLQTAAPVKDWINGIPYAVGDVVNLTWMYRCIVAHTSSLATEPGVGSWTANWEIISDYQYNQVLVDVQHCAASLAGLNPCAANPNACPWVDASLYNAASPAVSIQFNWLGVPVDYIDHGILVQGAQDAAGPPAQNRVGYVMLTVTSLGRIKHVGEQ